MSRIGKMPIEIPAGVIVKLENSQIVIEGPLGKLEKKIREEIKVTVKDGKVFVSQQKKTRLAKSLHGLTRTIIANMITGVTQGFSKKLELHGTGYRAKLENNKLVLQVGFSHPIIIKPPQGIEFKVSGQNKITVAGIEKQLVGNTAAMIRNVRKPEAYKGKGIRYQGEVIRKKPGKAAKIGAQETKYE